MTIKILLREICFVFIAYSIAFLPTSFCANKFNFFQDIYIGAATNSFEYGFSFSLTMLTCLPVLFLVITIRSSIKKFNDSFLLNYKLVIGFVSVALSLVALKLLHLIAPFVMGGWTIYPPLSAVPNNFKYDTSKSGEISYYYYLLIFINFQLLILAITVFKIIRKSKETI